ncbi:hypothetical protein QN277_003663 [Acacia crassicarpa]|uniref:RNase H type-1 domain-containing protein n=1 Tax=Acacia crassicarpa TaxID=499986 RepID=A0AAE1J1B0_9FABA|nr:hypothetical protein QN277_003663 [Acacia crassicarpa]
MSSFHRNPSFHCSSEESVLHVIRDCERGWLNWNTKHKPGKKKFQNFPWSRIFSLGCWILWTSRCKSLFQGESIDTKEMLYLCNYFLLESSVNYNLSHQISQLDNDRNEEKSWTPPTGNVVCIDVDGSVRQQFQAACGGVIRDSRGHWLMGFYKALGLQTVIEAELYAIMLRLTMAQQLGLQQILLYLDSLDVVNILMRDCCYADHPLRDIIGNIRDLLFRDWDVKLYYTSRDNIACADYLAKEGHNALDVVDVILIPTVPAGCRDMVLKDQLACQS